MSINEGEIRKFKQLVKGGFLSIFIGFGDVRGTFYIGECYFLKINNIDSFLYINYSLMFR